MIDNGLVLSRIDANWFKFAIGALTVFAVVGNSWLRRTAAESSWRCDVPAPIISIRGLHKWYSGVHALNGIDLDLESG